MKVIILAAGKGSRLGDYIQDKPKCLLPFGEETILSRQIRILSLVGIKKEDVYVVTGYKAEMLAGYANEIYNEHYASKENSYSLGLAFSQLQDDLLVLDGDLIFDQELIQQILDDSRKNVLLSQKSDDTTESTGILEDSSHKLLEIGKQVGQSGYVYLSIFKISKEMVSDFKEELLDETKQNRWYTDAMTRVAQKYEMFNLPVTGGKWHEVDFVEDYVEAKKMFGIDGSST